VIGPTKDTAELEPGDVVAVRPRPVRVDLVQLEHRYNLTRRPTPSAARWLVVEQVLGCAGYRRVDFTNGGFALAPGRNCAWYVQAPATSS
jgi:hypothetical protein